MGPLEVARGPTAAAFIAPGERPGHQYSTPAIRICGWMDGGVPHRPVGPPELARFLPAYRARKWRFFSPWMERVPSP